MTLEEQLNLVEIMFTNVRMTMIRKMPSPMSKLDKLTPAKLIVGDPEELVDLKVWEWNEAQYIGTRIRT